MIFRKDTLNIILYIMKKRTLNNIAGDKAFFMSIIIFIYYTNISHWMFYIN